MRSILLISFVLLAACGADGPPERPTKGGVALSGEARLGVVTN